MATLRFSNVSGLVSEKSIFLPFLAKPEKHKGMRFEIYPGNLSGNRDHFRRHYQIYLFSNLSATLWTEP